MKQSQIPMDADVGRLAITRPVAVNRVRRQIIGGLDPMTVDRLLQALGIGTDGTYGDVMTFDPGAGAYSIRISSQPLRNMAGAPALGLHVWYGRQILISPEVPRQQRLQVLLHEIYHAWRSTNGRSYDEEVLCDQFAACASAFLYQFAAQGGVSALMAMEPADPDDLVEHDERFDGMS